MAQSTTNQYLSRKLNKLGSMCPVIVRHEFDNQNDKVSAIMSMRSGSNPNKGRPYSAMSKRSANTKTPFAKIESIRKKGPISQAMVPIDFEGMEIRQKNNSKHFQPKVKLKTEGLKKVLFNLKRDKEDLDTNLERLELISNFGETYLKHSSTHDSKLMQALNMKANPVLADTRLKRPATAKTNHLRNVKSEPQFDPTQKKKRPGTAMTQFKANNTTDGFSNYDIPENDEEGIYYEDNSESR